MSLNGIMNSALSGLQTAQTGLSVVSQNIANMNTPGYTRRVVDQAALVSGNQLSGVTVSDIQRITDQFLNAQVLTAQGLSAQAGVQNTVFSQINGFLGTPGDGNSLTSQLNNIFSALGAATLSPTTNSNQQAVLSAFKNLANTVSNLSSSLSGLQTSVDQQIGTSVGTVNSLLKQIYQLNTQIASQNALGDAPSGLLDQRDQAVQQLSQYMGIKTTDGPNGQSIVSTQDGVVLVGDSYGQLSYAPSNGSTGSYQPIQLQMINANTGGAIGTSQPLDPHLASGQLQGYIDMRDGALAQLQQELGSFAQGTANSFNAQSNANAAFPPPTQLTGHNTGLLATDGLNFTGKTTIAIAGTNGNLVSRIDVDFGAGTLSVDGGAAVSIGSTVGSFATALNSALGSNGSASFSNGVLSIAGNGGNGVVVQDDATTPASRGGSGFSQFFGLNDIFRTSTPSIAATGLSASDAGGFTAGGTISMALKNANGQVDKTINLTLNGTESIGTIIGNLNAAAGGAVTFALDSTGKLTATPAAAYANDTFNVSQDSTTRGTTGVSLSGLFGLGPAQQAAMASAFSVNSMMTNAPQTIPFAQASLAGASAGSTIVTPGDARGLNALQSLANSQQSFARAGALSAQASSLTNYSNSFYQDAAMRVSAASANNTAQTNRLSQAQSQQSSVSGVNLDEELSNMMTYQQAYSASARVLTTVDQLYQTLLSIQ